MGKYSAESEELLKLVGGRSNIAAVSHCVTRMRFVLNDPSAADVKAIESMKVVKGTRIQAPECDSIPAQQFEQLHYHPVAASFPAETGQFPDTSNRRYGLFASALVPYISYLDCSFVVGSYSYRLR